MVDLIERHKHMDLVLLTNPLLLWTRKQPKRLPGFAPGARNTSSHATHVHVKPPGKSSTSQGTHLMKRLYR